MAEQELARIKTEVARKSFVLSSSLNRLFSQMERTMSLERAAQRNNMSLQELSAVADRFTLEELRGRGGANVGIRRMGLEGLREQGRIRRSSFLESELAKPPPVGGGPPRVRVGKPPSPPAPEPPSSRKIAEDSLQSNVNTRLLISGASRSLNFLADFLETATDPFLTENERGFKQFSNFYGVIPGGQKIAGSFFNVTGITGERFAGKSAEEKFKTFIDAAVAAGKDLNDDQLAKLAEIFVNIGERKSESFQTARKFLDVEEDKLNKKSQTFIKELKFQIIELSNVISALKGNGFIFLPIPDRKQLNLSEDF